jgi:hypothetical protein
MTSTQVRPLLIGAYDELERPCVLHYIARGFEIRHRFQVANSWHDRVEFPLLERDEGFDRSYPPIGNGLTCVVHRDGETRVEPTWRLDQRHPVGRVLEITNIETQLFFFQHVGKAQRSAIDRTAVCSHSTNRVLVVEQSRLTIGTTGHE